ncbi:amidohydrolase [Emcibacter sp. SYSU 3D8]|uniref:amidohydrolase n=1 Tax=Emcibacter sp. SYSU 3D8 TaxID=3133969 RepID=UPI0031FE74B6
MRRTTLMLGAVLTLPLAAPAAATTPEQAAIRAQAAAVDAQVIAWRRDIHQHPELGNREHRTAKIVADQLRSLGLEVRTGVAHTGVVGVLKGGLPGPVVALRADMDALPVTEPAGLPFASTVKADYNGQQVGVMHACGHDAHTAILLGAATVLAGRQADLPGTVVFLFQPAEEGVPAGETGGARQMIAEGALADPKADVVFGLHTWPGPPGQLTVRNGGTMAGSDQLAITVHGRQTHGAMPSKGVDPVTASAQIILGLQTMVTRQMDASASPVVISIGRISGGVRHNIIPDRVEMSGTIRHLDPETHDAFLDRIRGTIDGIAEVVGASADVEIKPYAPPVFNPPGLVARMMPSLERVGAGAGGILRDAPATMGAEDFAWYQKEVPGLYFFLGINKADVKAGDAAPNHSPDFHVNEAALKTGVEAMVTLTLDYMAGAR